MWGLSDVSSLSRVELFSNLSLKNVCKLTFLNYRLINLLIRKIFIYAIENNNLIGMSILLHNKFTFDYIQMA